MCVCVYGVRRWARCQSCSETLKSPRISITTQICTSAVLFLLCYQAWSWVYFLIHTLVFVFLFSLSVSLWFCLHCASVPNSKMLPPPNNEIPKIMFLAKINIKQAKKSQNNSYLNKSKNKCENKFWKYETVAHHPRQSYSKSTSTTGTKCPKRIQ